MPLGGLIDTENVFCEGHPQHPESLLPESATRPYTQVITTIVQNAVLNASFFHIDEESMPRSILFTKLGQRSSDGIFSITQIASDIFKVFSNEPLTNELLSDLFGASATTFVKAWGGRTGGATPDYQGSGGNTPFLLFDGVDGLSGHGKSGAVYYANSMEQSAVASMELCAIGAKAIARLISERLQLTVRLCTSHSDRFR